MLNIIQKRTKYVFLYFQLRQCIAKVLLLYIYYTCNIHIFWKYVRLSNFIYFSAQHKVFRTVSHDIMTIEFMGINPVKPNVSYQYPIPMGSMQASLKSLTHKLAQTGFKRLYGCKQAWLSGVQVGLHWKTYFQAQGRT